MRIFNNSNQDGMIILGSKGNQHQELLKNIHSILPGVFRSNFPVIMPIEYSNIIELKLDSHVIFYKEEKGATLKLIDKFSVKGGIPIVLELGIWEKSHGVIFKKQINRWDRRTDLIGAPFVNALHNDGLYGVVTYDKNGSIIGSEGWFQDIAFYITPRLNLSVTTIDLKEVKQCESLLLRKLVDVCSHGVEHSVFAIKFGQIPIAIYYETETLLAGVRTGTAPDAWVFIEVFGFWQWFAILSTLAVIAILWPIIQFPLEKNNLRPPLYEGLVTVSLFLIQNGNLPDSRFWARRLLALTTSMLTLVVFVHYGNDITSKMTAGPPPLNVRTFDDALDQGYEVVVAWNYHYLLLERSTNGTAKHAIYKKYFEQYENYILEYRQWKANQTTEEIRVEMKYDQIDKVPKWYFNSEQNKDWAAERVINEKKILWFCHASAQNWNNSRGKVVALKMDDSHKTYAGLVLQHDSEFMAIFNHYLLKAYENGILNRLDIFHNGKPDIKIGMNEPEALGMNNVMFPFSVLAASIVLSTAIAGMEKLLMKINNIKPKNQITLLK